MEAYTLPRSSGASPKTSLHSHTFRSSCRNLRNCARVRSLHIAAMIHSSSFTGGNDSYSSIDNHPSVEGDTVQVSLHTIRYSSDGIVGCSQVKAAA
ncbi:hypothetical protein GCK32_003528 [Trichostrongylus colubriformis]|uniref:Uncharacterized protein n=1 Tax=Trichostrongylus colubriformis TaxID=6319 RepID=A0AAN8FFB0_TRICO